MKSIKLVFVFFVLTLTVLSQTNLTLEEAINIAMKNSPDIRQSKLNLERSRELLIAENARLKSNFSLRLSPFSFSKDRSFDDRFSQWYDTESKQASGTFTISQPIKWTDATLSINNVFSYQDHLSNINDTRLKNYDNRLYLSLTQPLFTYNRTMLQLKELEIDYENATLNFNIQQLAIEQRVAQSFYGVYQQDMSLHSEIMYIGLVHIMYIMYNCTLIDTLIHRYIDRILERFILFRNLKNIISKLLH